MLLMVKAANRPDIKQVLNLNMFTEGDWVKRAPATRIAAGLPILPPPGSGHKEESSSPPPLAAFDSWVAPVSLERKATALHEKPYDSVKNALELPPALSPIVSVANGLDDISSGGSERLVFSRGHRRNKSLDAPVDQLSQVARLKSSHRRNKSHGGVAAIQLGELDLRGSPALVRRGGYGEQQRASNSSAGPTPFSSGWNLQTTSRNSLQDSRPDSPQGVASSPKMSPEVSKRTSPLRSGNGVESIPGRASLGDLSLFYQEKQKVLGTPKIAQPHTSRDGVGRAPGGPLPKLEKM